MQCVSCNQPLAPGTDFCPRCGADNRSWQQFRLSNDLQQMAYFVRQEPWIQVVAVIILLGALAMAVVALFNTKNTIYWLAGVILLPVISTALAYGMYSLRWKIREYEWLRKARRKWRPSILLAAIGLFYPSPLADLAPTISHSNLQSPSTAHYDIGCANAIPYANYNALADEDPLPWPHSRPIANKRSRHNSWLVEPRSPES